MLTAGLALMAASGSRPGYPCHPTLKLSHPLHTSSKALLWLVVCLSPAHDVPALHCHPLDAKFSRYFLTTQHSGYEDREIPALPAVQGGLYCRRAHGVGVVKSLECARPVPIT